MKARAESNGWGGVRLACMLALLLLSARAGADCVDFNAQAQQGGLIWGRTVPGNVLTLDGEPLTVLDDGVVVIGFGRDADATATLEVRGERVCTQALAVAARDYKIQRVEGVPAQTVNPPAEQLARIRKEGAWVREARDRELQRPDLLATVLEGFAWPVEGPISGVYGSQRYYNGEPKRPHYGVDVAVPTGTTVRAPAAGVVSLAEPDLFYSGGTVIVDHGYRVSSTFLHLSKVLVKPGDEILRGDVIGEVGATGRATGPHLDWRMNWRNRRIDPQLLVPPMPKR